MNYRPQTSQRVRLSHDPTDEPIDLGALLSDHTDLSADDVLAALDVLLCILWLCIHAHRS
jgi:hypothetical protein